MTSKEEFETPLYEREKAELEAEYQTWIYQEWSKYLEEFGLPENCGLWGA